MPERAEGIGPDPEGVAHEAIVEAFLSGSFNPYGGENLAERFADIALDALLALPVEQRMKAMGMELTAVRSHVEHPARPGLHPSGCMVPTWREKQ